MKMISPPPELMTEVAGQLLESARTLGFPVDAVATTTGAQFGYGFMVPDDLFDHWFLRRGEAAGTTVAADPPAEAFLEPLGPEVPLEEEIPVTPEVPEIPDPEVTGAPRRKRGVKAAEGEV